MDPRKALKRLFAWINPATAEEVVADPRRHVIVTPAPYPRAFSDEDLRLLRELTISYAQQMLEEDCDEVDVSIMSNKETGERSLTITAHLINKGSHVEEDDSRLQHYEPTVHRMLVERGYFMNGMRISLVLTYDRQP